MEILGLADDLTGALEVGAKFAGRGLAALVTTELSLDARGMNDTIQVLVIDTESRHLEPAEAAERVYRLARAGQEQGIGFIYKKTDSTLRGNIGSELGALLGAYPDSRVIYVPAYPQMGRTVRQGHLYVDGVLVSETAFARDRLNPIAHSYIPDLLAGQCEVPVRRVDVEALRAVNTPAIYVCDGETEHDVRAAARILMESEGHLLAAGPAALAERIAELVGWPRGETAAWPAIENCLVINGSLHEVSTQQVRHAEANGWRSVDAEAAAAAISTSHWVILKRNSVSAEAGPDAAAREGEMVRGILEQAELDGLIIFGGDTAYGVVKAMGRPPVYPMGEVVPGVPLSRIDRKMIGQRERDLYLITKAGGFGSLDILCLLRKLLSQGQEE